MTKHVLRMGVICLAFAPMLAGAQERDSSAAVRKPVQDIKSLEVATASEDSSSRAGENVGPVRAMAPESRRDRAAIPPERGTLHQYGERAAVRQEFGQTRPAPGNVRMKESGVSQADEEVDDVIREAGGTRDNGEDSGTDTSNQARARTHGIIPCPVVSTGDPASVAAGAASAGAGAAPGCGDPQD